MDGAAGIGESETLSCRGKQATHNRSEGHASVTVPPPRAVAIGRWEEGGEHGWREGWPPRRAPEGDVDEPPPHPAHRPLPHGSDGTDMADFCGLPSPHGRPVWRNGQMIGVAGLGQIQGQANRYSSYLFWPRQICIANYISSCCTPTPTIGVLHPSLKGLNTGRLDR